MPIRIRCRDKPLDPWQPIADKGVTTFSVTDPIATYIDRKPDLRILCGSV
jgi:hypothetical protein